LTIFDVCASFDVGGKYVGCRELSTGNINSTYQVEYLRDGEKKFYIVQRINTHVFHKPIELMDNIVRVTKYVHDKIKDDGFSTKKFVLHVFKTKEGDKPYFVDDEGGYWRCYRYIPNSETFDSCDDLEKIKRVGQAFGRFEKYLDGFDAASLHIPLPDFHNTPKRFDALQVAINADVCGRASKLKPELDRLFALKEEACLLQKHLDNGDIPLRVTHNDTKCNNVAFDKNTGEALAVLDLDTVMPGAVAYDFGDAIRFIANTREEDDPDVDNVGLDLNKYEAFTAGFIGEMKNSLTDLEKETINLGVLTMTVELAVRFMTDYLNGDIYFKTRYPGHNFVRARNQLALAEDVYKKRNEMQIILDKYVKE